MATKKMKVFLQKYILYNKQTNDGKELGTLPTFLGYRFRHLLSLRILVLTVG